jgi:hypothetical protein
VSLCPECGEPLVPELPPESAREPINEPLVAVYEAPDEVMSIMVRDLLEDAGIAVIAQPGRLQTVYDDLDFSLRGFHSRLLVFESRAEEARRLVAEYLADIESGALEDLAEQEEAESEKE